MRFRVFDRLSITKDGQHYGYTIDANDGEYGFTLGILDCCRILSKEIREVLTLCDNKGIYINSYTGRLHFTSNQSAEEFIKFIKEPQ